MMVLQNVLLSSCNSVVKTLSTIANVFLVHHKWIPEVMKAKNYGHLCSRKHFTQFMLYVQKNEETWDAI